jgi:hydrogenase-4 component F
MFLAYGNVQDQYPARISSRQAGRESRLPAEGELTGVLRAMPVTGWILALGGLALVGSPPFSIFLSEFIILWGGIHRLIQAPSIWLTFSISVFVISITLIFCGLIRHLGRMLLGEHGNKVGPEPPRRILPLLLLSILILLMGVAIPSFNPFNLHQLLNESVSIVCWGECR